MKSTDQNSFTFIKQYWQWGIGILLSLLALIGGLRNIDWLGEKLRPFLSRNIETDTNGPPLIDTLLANQIAIGLLVLVLFFVFSLLLGVLLFKQMRKGGGLFRKRVIQLEEELQEIQDCAVQIVEQTYKEHKRTKPGYVCEKVAITYLIGKNGDGTITENRILRASGDPVHYWEYRTRTEEDSPPAKFLRDIGFRLTEKNPKCRAVYLPLVNNLREKKVAIFHLPRMEPEEPEPREIEIKNTWPKLFQPLLLKNKDTCTHELNSKGVVGLFELTIYHDPDLGDIECELVSQPPAGEFKLLNTESQSGWPGWRFAVENAPADRFLYRLALKKKS